ncbi:MarR family transcriptional regulator [Paenibacillus paridis]|uniref:MarR family transcriptional regulator n=1 Tax=Paenibacillus paridis TaxID=2583376 RepID=UPI001EE49D73|nr:MarR family transcriptional regulator [Paenibacillus paridis]
MQLFLWYTDIKSTIGGELIIYHSKEKQNKDDLIKEFLGTANEIQRRFQTEDDEEKKWMIENSPNLVIAEMMKEMTVLSLHVLDAIGKLEPVNGNTISKKFGIPKGSVSKITRKLVDRQFIIIEHLPDNKKEILFRTTSLGKEIYHLHAALHNQIESNMNRFLQRYKEDDLRLIVSSLGEIVRTSWIYPNTISESSALSQKNSLISEEIETNINLGSLFVNEEINDIIVMLGKLDSRSLKKAKTILNDVFFTVYEE